MTQARCRDGNVLRLPTYWELLARKDAPPGTACGLFGADDEIGTILRRLPLLEGAHAEPEPGERDEAGRV